MRKSFTKAVCLLLCVGVLLSGGVRSALADQMTITEAYFTQPEQYSGLIEVPGKGLMRYYAQNDPLWDRLVYESSSSSLYRPFGDGGCCPTAGAMAIANLLPEEDLINIASAGKRDYSLCSCSLNRFKCRENHARYVLTTQRDYVRFLPLVFGDFATGNNPTGDYSRYEAKGTSTGFLNGIAQVYGVTVTSTTNYNEAIRALKRGCTVLAHAANGGCLTGTGHYVLLAHVDVERLYILDPLYRTDYSAYPNGKKVQVIQPGLIALNHNDVEAAYMGAFMIFNLD